MGIKFCPASKRTKSMSLCNLGDGGLLVRVDVDGSVTLENMLDYNMVGIGKPLVQMYPTKEWKGMPLTKEERGTVFLQGRALGADLARQEEIKRVLGRACALKKMLDLKPKQGRIATVTAKCLVLIKANKQRKKVPSITVRRRV